MVQRTLTVYECDTCGEEATRYTVLFEDGTKVFDRCSRHNKKLEALRNEDGDWRPNKAGKSSFHKSSIDELRDAIKL